MSTSISSRSERNSGIELLKIIAILLIVLNHVIQSLTEVNAYIPASTDYVINIWDTTTNFVNLVLAVLRSSGCVGNDIFVACSVWFLIGRKKADKKKVSFLICNVWVVSVIIFAVTYLLGCDLDRDSTLMQFFPTSNALNWFITCYMLFYLLHPLLNRLIDSMNQRTLLLTSAFLVFLYSICNYFRPWFFEGALFYTSELVVWIMIYFVIAYIKLYVTEKSLSTRANVIGLLIGIFGQAFMIIGIDVLSLKLDFLQNKLQYFNNIDSPFIILLAICALNLARKLTFKSRFVNYVSGLSLLIYIIHENAILRTMYRPLIFVYIYEHFGYSHILLWVAAVTLAIFIAAALVSALYSQTIERLVRPVSNKLYGLVRKLYLKIETGLLKIH